MTLSPDQFNAFYTEASRGDKKTVAGERFVRHSVLEKAGTPIYPRDSEAFDESDSTSRVFVTADGYGLGPRQGRTGSPLFKPDGSTLNVVETHAQGVGEIQKHRAGEHSSQVPQQPRGRFSGPLAERMARKANAEKMGN
jgi:hypothetical protein